ncbi:unnamed protein product [Diplocarpon coronariae]|uniref:Uncharacterized protein n=1 Tax=Diplocarpon coronariae TaxID=2795749 RepID=A0A218Z1S1_9HELO|nr:hypothetical protein JHW43_002159 [Diplocarpon mali]OWP01888.1 hypothetical protein B2J93_4738 [Marssonina coronariae]
MKFTLIAVLAQALAVSAIYCSGPTTVGGGDFCRTGSGFCCNEVKSNAFKTSKTCQSLQDPEGIPIAPECDNGTGAVYCC